MLTNREKTWYTMFVAGNINRRMERKRRVVRPIAYQLAFSMKHR